MFCKKCGTQLQDGTRFCTKCGHPVATGEQTPAMPAAPSEQVPVMPVMSREQMPGMPVPQTSEPEKSGSNKLLIGIVAGLAAVVIALIAVMSVILFSESAREKADAGRKDRKEQEYDKKDDGQKKENEEAAPKAALSENTTEEAEKAMDNPIYLSLSEAERVVYDRISTLNRSGYAAPTINVYEENYTPGVRNANATWDNKVFYQVEGIVNPTEYFDKNNCLLVKRQLWSDDAGNKIDYEIYKNPTTGKPNKIISLEYLADGMEVTEYYYTNDGKVNFIFQYYTDNYVSSYATPTMAGSRFLYRDDSMVTWRIIGVDSTINYVAGDAEAQRMKNQFSASTMKKYHSLTEDKRRAYDEMEKKMLNAAYNTYHTVMNAEGTALIHGYVNAADELGLQDVKVELFTENFQLPFYTTTTDSSGRYYIYVPNQEYTYNVRVSKDGYKTNDIYRIAMSNEQIEASQDTVYLFENNMGNADVSLKLGDALNYSADGRTMEALRNANIYVRNGMNNKLGDVIAQAQSDSAGSASLNLAPGMYTLEIASSGFENMYYNIQSNPKRMRNFYELYATPNLAEGELRIVLTWGETPRDLDSHLFTTVGNSADHIWYGDRNDVYGSNLDVDVTSSYGPETVTIPAFSNDNYYKYCVTDYTNCVSDNFNSMEMSYSNACVNVYSSNGLIGTFHVPMAREGVIWEVFEIRRGNITPIQRYYNTVTDKTWWAHE